MGQQQVVVRREREIRLWDKVETEPGAMPRGLLCEGALYDHLPFDREGWRVAGIVITVSRVPQT